MAHSQTLPLKRTPFLNPVQHLHLQTKHHNLPLHKLNNPDNQPNHRIQPNSRNHQLQFLHNTTRNPLIQHKHNPQQGIRIPGHIIPQPRLQPLSQHNNLQNKPMLKTLLLQKTRPPLNQITNNPVRTNIHPFLHKLQ